MIIIGGKNKKECFKECSNMAFHDLIAHDKLCMDMKTLLVLGPKSCI